MPRAGFYNDNEYRAYPFIYKTDTPTPSLPDACIVDCGIIMGLDSQYDETTHTVWLSSIHRAIAHFEFELTTDAPGAANKPLVFTRALNAKEWLTEHNESDPAADKECATEPAWEGFLVTGVLDELTANMVVGATRVFSSTDYVLEPARVQSLVKSYLRSISLGNYSRVVAAAPSECGGPENPPDRYVVVNKKCMQGDLKFKEGYNCQIFQVDRNNEIIVTAAVGAGAGDTTLCDEIKLFEDEAPPEGSKFLSGGPACDEIVFTVNGVNYEGSLQIIGGAGVEIRQDPNNEHGIIIERVDNLLVSGCQG
jgi:hypothetical protein